MNEQGPIINLEQQETSEPTSSLAAGYYVLGGLLLCLIVLGGVYTLQKASERSAEARALLTAKRIAERHAAAAAASSLTQPPVKRNYFDSIDLEAKSAIVFDIQSGTVLYEKNARDVLPLASITKVITAYVAESILATDDTILIDDEVLHAEGSTGLLSGEYWKYTDLRDHMLVTSSNDAALAIARAVEYRQSRIVGGDQESHFTDLMNAQVADMGAATMSFSNPSGLDIDTMRSGAYGSAWDVAKVLSQIYLRDPDLAHATRELEWSGVSENGISHAATNTNEYVYHFPGIRLSKTGYTDLAGGNLAIVVDTSFGKPLVIVVLGSTIDGRFTDVEKLIWATYDRLAYDLPE